ncbi:MAG: chromosome segregation protein SMC [Enterococcaceae bacterium]|nr:chromosome segregation protein SMC [Enterococcaceae bacterium]MCI1919631.1 chromosome segregation protein SMC [Enterococcaceae bacterium]
MYLKRIIIKGFKSFADATTIDLEPGVTGIVGPNGSGKSNITEAVRWVLGEQSAKNLRGGKMPDVIFSGSTTRSFLPCAEVTVVLDNSDHYLPLDYTEVSVTRKLNRQGDSDFLINQQASRLKDVQELFMDSGLGKNSFSIISQGKVEEIFQNKPEERREIFEEAAGVAKYKQKKHRAEQKLFETEDNLNRLKDILFELNEQLGPLKEQKEKGERFLTLEAALKSKEITALAAQIAEEQTIWQEKSGVVKEAEGALETLVAKIKDAETTQAKSRADQRAREAVLEKMQSKLLSVSEALKQRQGERAVYAERKKFSAEDQKKQEELIASLQTEAAEWTTRIEAWQMEESCKQKELEQVAAKIQKTEDQLDFYRQSPAEQLAHLRQKYYEVIQKLAAAEQAAHALADRDQEQNVRTLKVRNEVKDLEAKKDLNARAVAELEQKKAQLEAQLGTAAQTRAAAGREAETLHKREEALQKELFHEMSVQQQAQARLKSFEEIEKSHANFYQGVRNVLRYQKELPGIIGAVADVIEVAPAFSGAIETALGGAAQHVIVASESDGRAAIRFLRERKLGRCTFLPLTVMKPKRLPEAVKKQLAGCAGFAGIAAEKLTFAPALENIIYYLLGTTILAQDLPSGNAIAKKIGYRYRVVTLAGDLFNPGGSMTGGAAQHQNSVLSQKARISEQRTKVEQSTLIVAQLRESLAKLQISRKEAAEQQNDLQEEKQKLLLAQQALLAEIHEAHRESATLETQIKEKKQAIGWDEAGSEQNKRVQIAAQIEKLKAEQADHLAQIAELENTSHEREHLKEAALTALTQLQKQSGILETEKRQLEEEIAQGRTTRYQLQEKAEASVRQLVFLKENSQSQTVDLSELTEKITRLTAEQQQLKTALNTQKEARQAQEVLIQQQENQLSTWHALQKELLEKKADAAVIADRLERALDQKLIYLQDTYQMTYEWAQSRYPLADDQALAPLLAEVKQLKEEIKSLGMVNLEAIEQYSEVAERYQFLTGQRDDLIVAKEELFQTMSAMDEEVKTRFLETFQAIQKNFEAIFPKMFGGGSAELLLTDPSDLLTTGVEIQAQPLGKTLQNLNLLSGGERALTAITLLFAILAVKPVPFTILDEVEAALDEANVLRFGRYLQKYAKGRQFLVVTHRKGTMEACDVLYGVTMAESGVSKMISVKLKQGEKA